MTNPIYKSGLFYKGQEPELKLLGSDGCVELLVDDCGSHRYFLNGLLHREDGPALITSTHAEWYICGKQIHPAWLETRKDEIERIKLTTSYESG